MKYQVLRNCVIGGAPRKAKSVMEISDEAPKKRTYKKKKDG